jgi:hypothetical protein
VKIFAHHDATGAIHALIGVDGPEGATGGMLVQEPGMQVTEVEGADVDTSDLEAVRRFVASHRVEVREASPARLVEKG